MRVQHRKTDRTRRILSRVLVVALIAAAVIGIGVLVARRAPVSTESGELDQAYNFSVDGGTGKFSDFATQTADPYSAELVICEPYVKCNDYRSKSGARGLLFDTENNEALFAEGIYDRLYPASLTKIMTALVVLEDADLGTEVTMTEADLDLDEGSQMSDLEVGDKVTVEQLLNVLLVYSGNDAAMALARVTSGSVEEFVKRMNQKAGELGMTGTHFSNPHGLHEEMTYTTPYDVYLMLQEACKNEKYLEITGQSSYDIHATSAEGKSVDYTLFSTDLFFAGTYDFPGDVRIVSSKTGTTTEAGYCLALALQDSYGVPYIALLMHEESQEALYEDMRDLASQISGR